MHRTRLRRAADLGGASSGQNRRYNVGRLRISIAGIMGLVALVAVEVAALRSAEDGWVDTCRFVTVIALVLATFLARNRQGEEGAFWFGFAALGWATFVLVLDVLAAQRHSDSVVSRLLLSVLRAMVDRSSRNNYAGALREMRQFHILHLMLILPAGLLGGVICELVDRRRRRRAREGA
jgi:hypothetical protein